ncbi:MAG: hypothetical protein R6U01_05225 [Halorubrum sp.]
MVRQPDPARRAGRTRRSAVALAGTAVTASLAGCPTLNADEASYWSDSL